MRSWPTESWSSAASLPFLLAGGHYLGKFLSAPLLGLYLRSPGQAAVMEHARDHAAGPDEEEDGDRGGEQPEEHRRGWALGTVGGGEDVSDRLGDEGDGRPDGGLPAGCPGDACVDGDVEGEIDIDTVP